MGKRDKHEERFRAKTARDQDTGCLLWTAGRCGDGYGSFWNGQKTVKAHRYAYEASNGPIPPGLCVLHRCNNPVCVDPGHLYLGSPKDNVRQMVAQRRNTCSGLREEDVPSIRLRNTCGETTVELAREFGVSATTIARAVQRKHFRDVARIGLPPPTDLPSSVSVRPTRCGKKRRSGRSVSRLPD